MRVMGGYDLSYRQVLAKKLISVWVILLFKLKIVEMSNLLSLTRGGGNINNSPIMEPIGTHDNATIDKMKVVDLMKE